MRLNGNESGWATSSKHRPYGAESATKQIPTLKRGANEHCAYGASLRGLVVAAGVSLAATVCAIESAGSFWCGDNQRQNACRDQQRFDG